MTDRLSISNKFFNSRLFIGTGKFPSSKVMQKAIKSSGTEMVTIALRRAVFGNKNDDMISKIDTKNIQLLPNTSGARDTDEAYRIASIARELSNINWVKLEITPDPKYLLPDPVETLKAASMMVKKGFIVLPYINADPILAKKLEDAGTSTVMPLASPIGSNRGLMSKDQIKIIINESNIPVIIDAGIGSPSDACLAMEMGADAVLVNTAISIADDPAGMAKAFKDAVIAGRLAYLSGLPEKQTTASASSPLTGFLDS